MTRLALMAVALAATTSACAVHETRTVQTPQPATTAVVTPAPAASTTVYTTPSSTATTVYTR